MFIKQRDNLFADPSGPQAPKYDFVSGFNENFGDHSIYRTNYPSYLDYAKNNNASRLNDSEFFKSLEDKARSNQRATITRPHSIFTESSFSLPTAYYEQTTPYGDFHGRQFKKYQLDPGDVMLMESSNQARMQPDEDEFEDEEDDVVGGKNSRFGFNRDDDDANTFGFESDNENNGTSRSVGPDGDLTGEIIEAFNPNVQVNKYGSSQISSCFKN